MNKTNYEIPDTNDIYTSRAGTIVFQHRLPKAIGGVRLERDGDEVIIKPVDQEFVIGRGNGVRAALDNALQWILDYGKEISVAESLFEKVA